MKTTLQLWHEHTFHGPADPAMAHASLECALKPTSVVRRYFRALAKHDPATASHSLRVRWHALRVGEELGMDPVRRRQLGVAALLHDIGKMCTPVSLLNKPGPLNPEEYRRIQAHATAGEQILQVILPCPTVYRAVRAHHERHDGRGYPDGLTGHRIPLLARILAIADAFDAMTSARPYGEPLPRRQALEVLTEQAGRQFDPQIVACFTAVRNRARERRGAR